MLVQGEQHSTASDVKLCWGLPMCRSAGQGLRSVVNPPDLARHAPHTAPAPTPSPPPPPLCVQVAGVMRIAHCGGLHVPLFNKLIDAGGVLHCALTLY